MSTLILCIDRDDDIGRKAGINTPIIGREEALAAANQLALADPEDSDVNSMFYSISEYDKLKKDGKDVKLSVICGHEDLGSKADDAISQELEIVLDKLKPEDVIFISDGAEDEYVYPIVSSRIKISGVKKVYVKQSPNIENTIYVALKMMREQKIQMKVLFPIGLALIIWALASITGYSYAGWAMIAFALGGFFVVRAFNLENAVLRVYNDLRNSIVSSGVGMPFSAIGLIFFFGGLVVGLNTWTLSEKDFVFRMLDTIGSAVWWLVFGAIIYVLGRMIDSVIMEKAFAWNLITVVFSLFALGWITIGALQLFTIIIDWTSSGTFQSTLLQQLFLNIVFGISIAISGTYIHKYIKENITIPDEDNPETAQD